MNRRQLMLAALASGTREEFSPVQIQKLMFLLDKNIGRQLGGPFFNFAPYDYGPFDVAVYNEFSSIAAASLGEIAGDGKSRAYRLNDSGREAARVVLSNISAEYVTYIKAVAEFVQKLSFSELVSSIYKHYPEMKANSVFRG